MVRITQSKDAVFALLIWMVVLGARSFFILFPRQQMTNLFTIVSFDMPNFFTPVGRLPLIFLFSCQSLLAVLLTGRWTLKLCGMIFNDVHIFS